MATRQQQRQPSKDSLRQVRPCGAGRARVGRRLRREGLRGLRHALAAGATVLEVYAAPELFAGPEETRAVDEARRRGARVLRVGAARIASVSTQERPEGVVALVAQWPTDLGARLLGPSPLLLVVEGAERPGNLGSIVRARSPQAPRGSSRATRRPTSIHPKTVRASAGGVFHVPLGVAPSAPALAWLRQHGVVVGPLRPARPSPTGLSILTRPAALVLGSEKLRSQRGLARRRGRSGAHPDARRRRRQPERRRRGGCPAVGGGAAALGGRAAGGWLNRADAAPALHGRRRLHRPAAQRQPARRLHGRARRRHRTDAGSGAGAEALREHLRAAARGRGPRPRAHLHPDGRAAVRRAPDPRHGVGARRPHAAGSSSRWRREPASSRSRSRATSRAASSSGG